MDAKLEAYRLQNLDQIKRNQALEANETRRIRQELADEEAHRQQLHQAALQDYEASQLQKQKEEQDFLEALARSGDSAFVIADKRRQQQKVSKSAAVELPSLRGLKRGRGAATAVGETPIDSLESLTLYEMPLPSPESLGSTQFWLYLDAKNPFGSPSAVERMAAGGFSVAKFKADCWAAAFTAGLLQARPICK
jgi:hypothetical protein